MADASDPTFASLITPPGAAAIAGIRIRGPRVAGFLRDRFSRPVRPLRCVHGELRDESGAVIDDPVIVLHEGQDAADINLHGGPWVVASALELLRRSGFEVIEAPATGPLPLEMVEGQTTFEREVLAHLPLAATEQGVRMLLAQPAAWEAFLASRPDADAINRVLEDRCLDRLLRPPRVAIVGPPNVGKSTLANRLFAQERSITADLPGTTRDWVGETANLGGLPVMLLDTPGIRPTPDPIERAAIERSGGVVGRADLVVVVLDASAAEPDAASSLIQRHPDALLVLNKTDRLANTAPVDRRFLPTIATTGQGVDDLRAAIRARLGCADLAPDRPRWWTRRQRDLLSRAAAGESTALQQLPEEVSPPLEKP
jgi:tRNA modification GTPase